MPTLFRRFKWRTSNSCRSCVTPQTWLIRHQSVVHEREGQGPWTFLLDVVGIFPNEDAIVRIFGLLMLEQNANGPSTAPTTLGWKALAS